jgi:transcriptional regulator with XRE-family HTH domain
MNLRKLIGNRIRQARKEAKFSQLDVSKKLFKSRSGISEIETGRTRLDIETIAEFAKVLNKPIIFFLSDFSDGRKE